MATTSPVTDMAPASVVSLAAHALASGPARNTVTVADGVRTVRARRCPAGVWTAAVTSWAGLLAEERVAGVERRGRGRGGWCGHWGSVMHVLSPCAFACSRGVVWGARDHLDGGSQMAEVAAQPDGSAAITITAVEAGGLKALAGIHLPFLVKVARWWDAGTTPELRDATAFLKSLAGNPAESGVLTVTAPQAQALRGLLTTHVPDFEAVLAVVDSPAVQAMLDLAKAMIF